MKITETLESLLRLLVTTHSDRDGGTDDKPVAEWVARTNAVIERARATGPVAFTRPTPAAEAPPASDSDESSSQSEPDPAPESEEAHDAASVPGLLDSLISWVQSEPEGEPEHSAQLTPEPALPMEPEPVETNPEVEASLVPVDHDLTHLETAAHVAESLNLGFHLGGAIERIASASTRGSQGVPALREAVWLIERYIAIIEKRPLGADLHRSAARLARAGDAIAGLKALAETLDGAPGHDLPGSGRIRGLSPEPPPPAA